jgi:branched-chain amino acid transport system permease protein
VLHPGGSSLAVEGVGVRFGGVAALDGVSLAVPDGSVFAVVGPNGSGKTTLLNSVSGFVRVHRGTIRVGDDDLTGKPAWRRRGLGVGRAFQVPPIVEGWTIRQYLESACYLSGADGWVLSMLRPLHAERRRADVVERALGYCADLGVDVGDREPMQSVSLGSLKLIDVARAAVGAERMLLLDEPTSGLGLGELDYLRSFVATCAAAGVTVVIVEHNLEFVADVADGVAVLDTGTVVASGTPAAVFADERVRAAYMGAFARTGALAGTGGSGASADPEEEA